MPLAAVETRPWVWGPAARIGCTAPAETPPLVSPPTAGLAWSASTRETASHETTSCRRNRKASIASSSNPQLLKRLSSGPTYQTDYLRSYHRLQGAPVLPTYSGHHTHWPTKYVHARRPHTNPCRHHHVRAGALRYIMRDNGEKVNTHITPNRKLKQTNANDFDSFTAKKNPPVAPKNG